MTRVAIIDDTPEARTLIRVALGTTEEILVVAEAADMDEDSLARIFASHPDVIVIDRRLPSGDGASLVGRLRELAAGTAKVVLYSIGDPTPSSLLEEPDAYVLIEDDINELSDATVRVTGASLS